MPGISSEVYQGTLNNQYFAHLLRYSQKFILRQSEERDVRQSEERDVRQSEERDVEISNIPEMDGKPV